MKKFILSLLSLLLVNSFIQSQGCVVVRNISGFGQFNLTDNAFSTSNWQVNIASRYFKSFRDFRGTTDQKTPEANQSVNHVYSMDFSITRMLSKGWSLNLSLPVTSNDRTSSGEHGGPNTKRYTTRSFGLGDIRITAYKWLIAPSVKQRGNIQLGLGIKLPNGDYKYQDYFYRNDTTRVLSGVNPSIQLGDGGTGIITELNTFCYINTTRTLSLFGNIYYLFNPRDLSGTQYTMGRPITPLQQRVGAVDLSVPDVYSIRAGILYNLKKWGLSAALRDEGTPVYDVFGESNGIRRAGHNLSIEPGILFKAKKATLYAYVPVIIGRKIKQNVSEKLESDITGTYVNRPGGFANYLIFLGAQFKL